MQIHLKLKARLRDTWPDAYIVHAKQFLVLLTKSIFWFCENLLQNETKAST